MFSHSWTCSLAPCIGTHTWPIHKYKELRNNFASDDNRPHEDHVPSMYISLADFFSPSIWLQTCSVHMRACNCCPTQLLGPRDKQTRITKKQSKATTRRSLSCGSSTNPHEDQAARQTNQTKIVNLKPAHPTNKSNLAKSNQRKSAGQKTKQKPAKSNQHDKKPNKGSCGLLAA